ncbi:MAG TPA: LLM class F420-dependent oxidoreductase [Ktedonobacterales bacterium]|nr:LLM class F420-dependent oxidoreductase [Ktedonobacterales bacterium]
MRVGLHIPNFTWAGGPAEIRDRLATIVRTADDAGFSFITVMDHFFQIGVQGPVEMEMLEGYSALAYIAGATRKVRLGTMVTGVTYRHPGVLVKTVTTVDVLSGGRAFLGLGAAWFEREHLGLGVPYPPLKERFERLEETLQIAHQMFAANLDPYQGQHYQLAEPLLKPAPLSQPRIPILIGGSGEQKTLRLVAKYADGCNLFGDPETARQKLAILKQHCEEVGRPYQDILRTVNSRIAVTANGANDTLTPAQAVEQIRALGEAGVQLVNFSMPNVSTIEPLELFGREIIPAIADLGDPAPAIWWG